MINCKIKKQLFTSFQQISYNYVILLKINTLLENYPEISMNYIKKGI